MSDKDRSVAEFVSEAQEVIEEFSRNLVDIETQQRSGEYDPDLLNAAFRAVHSLKGLAGLFGATAIAGLSHTLESTLDALRLGKLPLDQRAMDVLFEAVDVFQRQLAHFAEPTLPEGDPSQLLARIQGLGDTPEDEATLAALEGIDEAILGVLTEYEEHRLRENIRLGRILYRVHASFDLLAIDVGIETLKEKMKAYGEVITYLPSADGSSDDRIELDILLGSKCSLGEVAAGVAEDEVTVHELGASARPPRKESTAGDVGPDLTPTPIPTPAAAKSPEPRARAIAVDDGLDADVVAAEMSLRSLSQTVRVDLYRLDNLMNLVGELGVVQASLVVLMDELRVRDGVSDVGRDLQIQVRTMARKLSTLQQGISDVRMVPLGQVFDKLNRVVRKLGREAEKDVRLHISGADTELDKLIVEELSDPLMHMIRNCIDHGIESPSKRVELGKSAGARIDLRAFQKGNRVVIEVEDDGRGIDPEVVRKRAVNRHIVSKEDAEELTPSEALNFIFLPGFTTKDQATEISGRGVGMDVVKTNISRLSGMIDVDTRVGRGTRFAVTLPVTLAIIQALVIESSRQTFCIPLNSVLESIMVQERQIATVEGHQVISLRGRTLPLLHLSHLFDLAGSARGFRDPERIYVVIVGLAQHRVGLVVDELLGQQDVVIKPLGTALSNVPGIAGATELGASRTVLLLDVATLVAESVRRVDSSGSEVTADGP